MNRRARFRSLTHQWIVLLLILAAHPDRPAFAADEKETSFSGKIAFFAGFANDEVKSEWGLFVVDPNTNRLEKVGVIPIKNGPIALADFRLSPDGKRIAYGEMKTIGHYADWTSVWLRELHPDAKARQISAIPGRPIWSGDGKQLLVVRALGVENAESKSRIVTSRIDDDGSHEIRLPLPEDFKVEDWSADGKWIVGTMPSAARPRDFEVVIMHPDGTGRRSLTEPGQRFLTRFSPDSRYVAFVESSTDPKKGMKGKSVGVVDLDGQNLRRVYTEPDDAYLESVAWSPDGKQLVTKLSTWTRRSADQEYPLNPRLGIIDLIDGKVRFVTHPRATILGFPQWR